jgi:hypothetical protein
MAVARPAGPAPTMTTSYSIDSRGPNCARISWGVMTWVTMARADAPGLVYAAGGATTMWVDFPRQKAIDLPDWLRELVTP